MKGAAPVKDKVRPKWVWRQEKIPVAYRNIERGNVWQTIKSNHWGRKMCQFYERAKVMHNIIKKSDIC